MEPVEVRVGDYTYYIHPFGAFKAANLSAELVSLLGPLVAGVFSTMDSGDEKEESAATVLMNAFGSLTGDKVERLLGKLILSNNVAVDFDGNTDWLRKDNCDVIFCRKISDMYKLTYEVIKVNFGDFFELFNSQSGKAEGLLEKMKSLK